MENLSKTHESEWINPDYPSVWPSEALWYNLSTYTNMSIYQCADALLGASFPFNENDDDDGKKIIIFALTISSIIVSGN